MPQFSYPGVYIEEVENANRTIVRSSTSVTGFIGRARKGPINKTVKIINFSQFENIFGGLWYDAPMSYSVYQFFLNGGKDAVIVRVAKEESTASATFEGTGIDLVALNAGTWANGLKVKISKVDGSKITIQISGSDIVEEFNNVELNHDPQFFIGTKLETESSLIRLKDGIDTSMSIPNEGEEITLTHGTDGVIIGSEQIKGVENLKTGIHCFDEKNINLMVVPPFGPDNEIDSETFDEVAKYCQKRRAMLIVDSPITWISKDAAYEGMKNCDAITPHPNAAIFFPRIMMADPLKDGLVREFTSSGAIAGLFARTDEVRGVWKSPAGINADLRGTKDLVVHLTINEIGILNEMGLNCLRNFSSGIIIWGSRTSEGADYLGNKWKYIAVRRTALYIEQTLERNLEWVTFQPNDEPLWAKIRMSVGSFMHDLFKQGAFQGLTQNEAYFVECDKETTTQDDIDKGIVNILVGFAPLKPAEFFIIKISQLINPGK